MYKAEDSYSGNAANAQTRRLALSVLTISGAELIKEAEEDRDFAVALASVERDLPGCLEQLRALVETLEAAQLRIMIALCTRDDMRQVQQEASQGEEART